MYMIKIKPKKLVFSSTILISFFIGCETNRVNNDQSFSLKLFSFKAPYTEVVSTIEQSENGDTGKILFGKYDTIYFNFGYEIDNLSEKDPSVIYYPYDEKIIRNNLDSSIVDPNRIVYTKKINFDIDEYRNQNVYFEIISGLPAKITLPRRLESGGMVGVYFDSLKKDEGGRLKFNFYSKSVDSISINTMLNAIRSIKFKVVR